MVNQIDDIYEAERNVRLWEYRLRKAGYRVDSKALDIVFEALNFYRETFKDVWTTNETEN